jgi:hypothetical protein
MGRALSPVTSTRSGGHAGRFEVNGGWGDVLVGDDYLLGHFQAGGVGVGIVIKVLQVLVVQSGAEDRR